MIRQRVSCAQACSGRRAVRRDMADRKKPLCQNNGLNRPIGKSRWMMRSGFREAEPALNSSLLGRTREGHFPPKFTLFERSSTALHASLRCGSVLIPAITCDTVL